MWQPFLQVLLQVLVHKSQNLLEEEICFCIYNMAAVDFPAFHTELLPAFLGSVEGLSEQQQFSLVEQYGIVEVGVYLVMVEVGVYLVMVKVGVYLVMVEVGVCLAMEVGVCLVMVEVGMCLVMVEVGVCLVMVEVGVYLVMVEVGVCLVMVEVGVGWWRLVCAW